MIAGRVLNSEALVRLQVYGVRDSKQEISAVVDTGYPGVLTLPAKIIRQLRLTSLGTSRGILADGSECKFTIYSGIIKWDGEMRRIQIDESDSEPLVGMELLNGFELNIQVRNGGKVTITKIP